MVIDYLVQGKHRSGHGFYTPIRLWGPRRTDFGAQLANILGSEDDIESWTIEERNVRHLLSIFYFGKGSNPLKFVFY